MKKLYHKFFYIPKHEKVSEKAFMTRTVLSVMTMLLCVVILCSASYAYFIMSVSSTSNTIATANYDLVIEDRSGAPVTDVYTCRGASDHVYTFTLTASGTAQKGYCKIIINGDVENPYFTEQIAPNTTFTLHIETATEITVAFVPSWGTSAASVNNTDYENGATIKYVGTSNLPTEPAENDQHTIHTVVEGDNLYKIAVRYGTTVAAICEYNNITQENLIWVGQKIVIPTSEE